MKSVFREVTLISQNFKEDETFWPFRFQTIVECNSGRSTKPEMAGLNVCNRFLRWTHC